MFFNQPPPTNAKFFHHKYPSHPIGRGYHEWVPQAIQASGDFVKTPEDYSSWTSGYNLSQSAPIVNPEQPSIHSSPLCYAKRQCEHKRGDMSEKPFTLGGLSQRILIDNNPFRLFLYL